MPFWVRWGTGSLTPVLLLLLASLTTTPAGATQRAAYVLASNASQLDRVDLDTGTVTPGVATAGSVPNRAVYDPNTLLLALVNSGSDDVTLVDVTTEATLSTVPLPSGSNPWTAEIAGGRVYVTGTLSNQVYEIDPGTMSVVDSVAVGKSPEGMAVAGGNLYVANTGFDFGTFLYDPGSVSVIDLATLAPVATIPVATNPQECLLAPDGTVHVVCTGDFGAALGRVDVIDPGTQSVTGGVDVAAFPGGGAVGDGNTIFLNVTTTSFGSEVWSYDAVTLALTNDGADPLLPSSFFYGNPASASATELLVPNFSSDLLLVEDPGAAGTPAAYLVGDGPIDVVYVERQGPVALVISGVSAFPVDNGIAVDWNAAADGDVAAFRIERREAGGPAAEIPLRDLPVGRDNRWIDDSVRAGMRYGYRVGAVDFAGETSWSAEVSAVWTGPSTRLAFGAIRPNPSRGAVQFDLAVPAPGTLTVELFDVSGRRIARLDGASVPAGNVTVDWDGADDRGRAVGPGMYLARATVGGRTAVERVLRLR